MFNYYKEDFVRMINLNFDGYPSKKFKVIDAAGYDKVFVSNIFDVNKDKYQVINCGDVTIGGIGSNNPKLQLPCDIENTEPYYHKDEDTSHGFITRGCIRNCWFCKVPKYEGKLREYNTIESVVKHDKVKFYDNNILAYDKHMEVFQWLIERNIHCDFNQGLDFRLVNHENAEALSQLNYMGEYIFAFDDPKYEKYVDEKLIIIKQYIPKDWKIKFYIYQNTTMAISDLIRRVEWCRDHKCLPYVMRDINCWDAEEKNFYIDYAAYCNQPGFFKKMDFETFLNKRHKNTERITESCRIYEENNYSKCS